MTYEAQSVIEGRANQIGVLRRMLKRERKWDIKQRVTLNPFKEEGNVYSRAG